MEKKINHTSDRLKKQDKPGFQRAKDNQHGLSEDEKKESKETKKDNTQSGKKNGK